MLLEASAYSIDKYKYDFFSFSKDKYQLLQDAHNIFNSDAKLDAWRGIGHNDVVYARNAFLQASVRIYKKIGKISSIGLVLYSPHIGESYDQDR